MPPAQPSHEPSATYEYAIPPERAVLPAPRPARGLVRRLLPGAWVVLALVSGSSYLALRLPHRSLVGAVALVAVLRVLTFLWLASRETEHRAAGAA